MISTTASGTALTTFDNVTFTAFFNDYQIAIYWIAGSILFFAIGFGILEVFKKTEKTKRNYYK